jgi:hypothetical protein
MSEKAPWITYRPALKVLDCTIRDGGLVNNHQFSDELVRAVYDTCLAAGIDYMEIGYKNTPRLFPKQEFGPWKYCHEEDLNRVVGGHDGEATGLKLSAMADAEKSDWKEQLVPRSESVLDMIRVAFYAHQVSEAVQMIEHAHSLGYETTANLMAVSKITETEIDTVLDAIAPTPADVMVIVDSFGYLYREQIDMLYKKYASAMEGTGKEIGMHAHNNHGERDRHARPQQHAAGVRQHDRGDHPGLEPGRRDDDGDGARGRQLPDGAAARIPAQSEVLAAPGAPAAARPDRSAAGQVRLGSADPLQHHGAVEYAPAGGDSVPGRRREERLRQVLRSDNPGRLIPIFRGVCRRAARWGARRRRGSAAASANGSPASRLE